jgi:opacity protein-like surface antigen
MNKILYVLSGLACASLPFVSVSGLSFDEISSVNFKLNSAAISTYNQKILDDVAKILSKNKQSQILLIGNTDGTIDRVDPNYNGKLARKRALAIKSYLLQKRAISANHVNITALADVPTWCNSPRKSVLGRRVDIVYCASDSDCQQRFDEYTAWLEGHCDGTSAAAKSLNNHWYVSGSLGVASLVASKQLSVLGNASNTENYQLSNTNAVTVAGLGAGYSFTQLHFWPHVISLGLQYSYANNMTANGVISDYGIDSYNYNYQIQQQNIMLLSQFQLLKRANFTSYFEVGLGFARNTAKGYHEAAIDPAFARDSLAYQNHTTTAFAYELGLGIGYQFSTQWQVSLGYDYLDAGTVELGKSAIYPTDLPSGAKQKLTTNQFKFGLTYHF